MKVLRTFECVIGHTYANRNGTVVTKDAWDKALMNHCGTIFGYLRDSDADTMDFVNYSDPMHICMQMRDYTISNETVHAIFDILDTSCGRVLNTLIDSGAEFSIYPVFIGSCDLDGDISFGTITGFSVLPR